MTDVRPAAAADYDRIIAVVDDWWGREIHPVLPRLFLDHFHRTSLVAETRGDLAAFLVGFLSPSDADTAYVHFAGVAPAHRGTGLARRLYEAFFAMARADDRTTVRALTSPRNTASIAFHRAMGFTTADAPSHDGPGEDKVLFHRRLDA
ncbi:MULTISPECIES: GNAT family N-acetyltransferase [Actinomadura]|uniref:Acetyltransferase (GNAT) family protein n=1 Tax=Actinomadura madurae TaxID=1993 RepID=A0A1I4WCZ5_9ACTN|nr:GNAT family N-acetyltransferase [Actinomadura madurae]SFN11664.1 Acetyltransferase (GNAT) family protein [Actinomadura madurae]SPT63184.1 Predicted acetyltransferase, GNAT superfamily [Actinomadura madurae]